MSFVSVVVGYDFITVMADRRAIETLPNGEYGQILNEQAEKIATPVPQFFYSIVGNVKLAVDFIENSKMIERLINKNEMLVSDIEVLAWFKANELLLHNGKKFGLAIGGESEDGSMRVFRLDAQRKEFQESSSQPGMVNVIVFPSSKLNQSLPLKHFYSLLGNSDGSIKSILNIQEKVNDEIANIDISVNKLKTCCVIKKTKLIK